MKGLIAIFTIDKDSIAGGGIPFVFYESPYRIIKVLTELKEISSNLRVVVGREMTKIHEEFIVGTVDEVVDKLKIVKGEFAVCVLPNMCDFKLEKPED